MTRAPGRCCSTAPTCARSTCARCVRPSRSSATTRSCSPPTVAENIAYAHPDATREAIEQAARRAQAHEFIARLPDGYDTLVGERGLTLSGGQRQRLAIARALLADPRVLILDDATSSVDASTERLIKLALDEAMAGRTTFIIAHRLSTIALADEIVVLDHGRIAAHGNHEELLEVSELYREIVEKGLPDQVFLTARAPPRTRGQRDMSAHGGGTGWWAARSRTLPVDGRARREGHARAQPARPAAIVGPVSPARERDVDGARARHGRLAGAPAAGEGRDRRRDRTPRHPHARAGGDRVPDVGACSCG